MKNSISKIRKRDGRIVDFDQQRITNAIFKAIAAVKEEDRRLAKKISDRVVKILNERFSPQSVPSVEQIQDIVIETLKSIGEKKVAEAYEIYRKKRTEIRETKYFLLNHTIRTKLSENALKVLEARYLRKDANGKITETPTQLFQRVAQNIAAAEKIYNPEISDDDLFKVEEKFYRMMALLEFLPNSPTLMNAGAPLQQLSACFVLPIDDSMASIFEAVKSTALIHQSGGGTGFSFSRLRPKGDIVKTTSGTASGPVSFMKVFDAATETVKQGGKRRGANMGILRVDHPDIIEFVTAKKNEGILQNFNISVAVTNEFMEAVKKRKNYPLINPRNNQPVKEMEAGEVFDLITQLAWETGDPGVVFIDRMNNDRGNPTPKLGAIEATNPCGEQPLLPYESCNLGSINLDKILKGKKAVRKSKLPRCEVDWRKLKKTVWSAVHFLDNAIDMNRYPLPEIEAMTRGNRRIGLGVMGWADLLIKLEIPYNSPRTLKLAELLMKFIDKEAKKASAALAKTRGVFPNFKDSVYDRPGGLKLRNCALTTIAPTGTIGVIAGCSQGIEPIFALAYVRKTGLAEKLGEVSLLEINPYFKEVAQGEGFYSEKLMTEVARFGSIVKIKEVPEKWRKIFMTAHDLNHEDHIRTQAAFQKYVDNAVSKTINFPREATVDDIKKAYMLAWEIGCKGITVYRYESKSQQVLNIPGKEEESAQKIPEKEVPPVLRNPSPELPDLPPDICPTCTV